MRELNQFEIFPGANRANSFINRYLDTNGDGTGTKNAIGNYASAATEFFIQPESTQVFGLSRLLISVIDVGSIDSGSYGNGISLSNGITVAVLDSDDNVLIDLTDGGVIITNVDWAKHCYDVSISDFGLGNNYLNVRWTFAKYGGLLLLDGRHGDRLRVVLNDDFSDLVGHYFMTQGMLETI